MSVNFMESETKVNLMRAFAGESMARNRYVFSADFSKKEHFHVLEQLFRFTADQEQQHAKIFYNHLQELSGKTVVIDAGYPVDLYPDAGELLRAAQHNEYEEHDDIYQKFGRFAELVEQKKLFVSDTKIDWICLKCGYVCNGLEAPKTCPVCGHDQGYFMRLSLCQFE